MFSNYIVMRAHPLGSHSKRADADCRNLERCRICIVLAPVIADQPVPLVVSLFIATWIGNFGSLKSRYSYAWVFSGITTGLVMTGPRCTRQCLAV
jgi:hypothetical protein